MKPWFRHYIGAADDEKLMRVASRTRQTLERVSFCWMKIMESASNIDSEGLFSVDAHDISWKLHCEPEPIQQVLDAFDAEGLTDDSVIVKWKVRQYEAAPSTARVHKFRRKQSAHPGESEAPELPLAAANETAETQKRFTSVSETPPEGTEQQKPEKFPSPSASAREFSRSSGEFERRCRQLVGQHPVLLAQDFTEIEALLSEGASEADIIAGITAAMATPSFRPRYWRQICGWARRAARERLEGTANRGARAPPRGKPNPAFEAMRQIERERYERAREGDCVDAAAEGCGAGEYDRDIAGFVERRAGTILAAERSSAVSGG